MAERYGKMVDLLWADDGDFVIEPQVRRDALGDLTGGDFQDTKRLKYRAWLQRVNTRLVSAVNDWKYLGIGADLKSFMGAENSEKTSEFVRARIIDELTRDDLCRAKELQVEVIPLSPSYLGIIVAARPPGAREDVIITHGLGLRDTNAQVKREV